MGRKRKSNKVPKVHPELEGLDLNINEFGEIISNIDIDKVNKFLTKEVPDKKLINRKDDAYQQEFKAMGFGKGGDDEDEGIYIEETNDTEDDDLPFVIDAPLKNDKEEIELEKDVEALDEDDINVIKKSGDLDEEEDV